MRRRTSRRGRRRDGRPVRKTESEQAGALEASDLQQVQTNGRGTSTDRVLKRILLSGSALLVLSFFANPLYRDHVLVAADRFTSTPLVLYAYWASLPLQVAGLAAAALHAHQRQHFARRNLLAGLAFAAGWPLVALFSGRGGADGLEALGRQTLARDDYQAWNTGYDVALLSLLLLLVVPLLLVPLTRLLPERTGTRVAVATTIGSVLGCIALGAAFAVGYS